jgi:hypothetical protein
LTIAGIVPVSVADRQIEVDHAMSANEGSKRTGASFWRSAQLLVGCVLMVGLLILPFAMSRTGSSGPQGLAIAGAIALVTGLAAESIGCLLQGRVMPVAVMLLGMTIRMLPPLAICTVMAATGTSGRAHLAFIFYLLAFYLVTLAFETWSTVTRVAAESPKSSLAH